MTQPTKTETKMAPTNQTTSKTNAPGSETNSLSTMSTTLSDFAVIWHTLTYRVDSRPWYDRTKERFFGTSSSVTNNSSNVEDGRSSAYSSGSGSKTLHPTREKIILNQVCGSAKSRQLTAIMGPSGAGKSSLLHCLFQNRTVGTTGRILVDSRSKSKLKVCFIPQRDYLNEWLSVREDLVFVSKLKLARISTLLKDDSNESSSTDIDSNDTSIKFNQSRTKTYVRQKGNECNTSLIDHEANAIRVAELLGLTNCLDVKIKNISGGQKKRLSIARELMSKPDILVLDEPTTGLDSLTCYKTVQLLRDLAHLSPHPMAVVVTIHQPQTEVFNLFDKTYFLSCNGRVIFEDNPKLAIETITNVANVMLPQKNYNPASFLIDIASDELQANNIDKLSKHQTSKFHERYDSVYVRSLMKSKSGNNNAANWKFCTFDQRDSAISDNSFVFQKSDKQQSFNSGDDCVELSQSIGGDTTTIKKIENYPNAHDYKTNHYYISYQLSNCLSSHSNNLLQSFRHTFILTHRSWLSVLRNPTFTKSRLIFHTLLPLIMLMVFGTKMGNPNNCPKLGARLEMSDLKKSINDGAIAQNVEETRLSLENISFFFILMYGFGINIISCTASFYPLTMQMFKKETINGLYSPASYFVGQMLAELPLEILLPSLSILISYPLSGQLPSFLCWRMFACAYIMFLVSYCMHSLGLLCGSIFVNNVSVAVLTGQVALFPAILLSGFLVRPSRMSDWMNKLSYASPFKLGLAGVMSARYGFNVCDCDEDILPEEGSSVKFSGLTPQVKHVLDYLFPKNNDTTGLATNDTDNLELSTVFDKLSQSFIKAQTFALDINTCDDVKPYILHVFGVEDSSLYVSIGCLLLIITVFKLVTFSIMKSFPYRIT